MALLEAWFRLDYLNRVYARRKDSVSRSFRELYSKYEEKASLEQHIFEAWKEHLIEGKTVIGELKGAFKFRHWMAHGRYWTKKFGKDYDYFTIYAIACKVNESSFFE